MVEAQIVPAEPWHISFIAERMRQADKDELYASGLYEPKFALSKSLELSTMAWTGLINDKPICMFGVAPLSALTGSGIPWMMGTDDLEKYSMAFLKRCKRTVQKMHEQYKRLENYADCRNTTAIKWLKWLKFKFDEEPVQYGALNMPFVRFYREA